MSKEIKLHLTKYEQERLQKAKVYILEHLNEPISLKKLMKITAMNSLKINDGFLFLFGKRAAPFIREAKMQTAMFLLKQTDKTIKQIAGDVGYRYTENFMIAFKKHFGVTAGSVKREATTYIILTK